MFFSSLPSRVRPHAPRAFKALALLLLAAGLGGTAAIVLAPEASVPPPVLADGAARHATLDGVQAWFGGGQAPVDIRLQGLISDGREGVALLSVDRATPRAFQVGQTLAPGVILRTVHADGIVVDANGLIREITFTPAHD